MKTYKAFNQGFTCRDFQFEVGQTYTHAGEIITCQSGFHACENPFDVLNYYELTTSRFAICESSGVVKTHENDSKIASSEITIVKELSLKEFIQECVEYNTVTSGDKLSASGDKLYTSDYNINLTASDDYCKLSASGNYSKLVTSGSNSYLTASGDHSQLAASGNNNQFSTSGYYCQQSASGAYNNLSASGHYSNLAASGRNSKLSASGHYSNLAASGNNSICSNIGLNGRVKGGSKCALALTYKEVDGSYNIVSAKVGLNGIKVGTWYKLDDNTHEFVECD